MTESSPNPCTRRRRRYTTLDSVRLKLGKPAKATAKPWTAKSKAKKQKKKRNSGQHIRFHVVPVHFRSRSSGLVQRDEIFVGVSSFSPSFAIYSYISITSPKYTRLIVYALCTKWKWEFMEIQLLTRPSQSTATSTADLGITCLSYQSKMYICAIEKRK